MALRHKLAPVLLAGVAALFVRLVQAKTPEDRCDELFDIYFHYVDDRNHHLDGEVARAEFAKYQCKSGHSAEGLRTLEAILMRNQIRYPTE
jgi:hypothetical protein